MAFVRCQKVAQQSCYQVNGGVFHDSCRVCYLGPRDEVTQAVSALNLLLFSFRILRIPGLVVCKFY